MKSTTEIIESRTYLLDFQKERLKQDLEPTALDESHLEAILDNILFKLFGTGWNTLTAIEQFCVRQAWKEIEK